MTNAQRQALIILRLREKFSPHRLEVIDQSDEHIGHSGAQDGAGHFDLIIDKDCFGDLNRLNIHKAIYQVLNDLIPHEIHALSIQLVSEENESKTSL
ncbi:MAG: BolA family transcriptional regulator [Legionellales bacterium]|nr:BolA family transcriptional regulator [Legionellales bacterium]|tara:strand:- start:672 stop:962 length:291 start_codon:yes stop_codon:yes gene_type:complete